jgi:hypothetical protein
MRRDEVVVFGDSKKGSTRPQSTGANETEANVGWPTSMCVVGIVLQQFSP